MNCHHEPPSRRHIDDTVQDLIGWGLEPYIAKGLTREFMAGSIANVSFNDPDKEDAKVILATLWGSFGNGFFQLGTKSQLGPITPDVIHQIQPLIDRPLWVAGWQLVLKRENNHYRIHPIRARI